MSNELMQCKACEGQTESHEATCVHYEVPTPWYRHASLLTTLAFFGVAVTAALLSAR